MARAIASTGAPAAIGPYSPAIRSGSWLFLSGQIPLDPHTGTVVTGDISAQTERVFRNIAALLEAASAQFSHVVRTTVYLTDLADFTDMNTVYAQYFAEPFPARSTVQVSRLPRDARIEIDVIALVD